MLEKRSLIVYMKIFWKLFITLFVVGGIFVTFYSSSLLNDNIASIKDMGYNLEKSEKFFIGGTSIKPERDGDVIDEDRKEPYELEYRDYQNPQAGKVYYDIQIKDVRLEGINRNTDSIIKGEDYYIFYTVSFTPKTGQFQMSDLNSIGQISSEDWMYKNYIPEGHDEIEYIGVIEKDKTVDFNFRIKTNEPIEQLGFYPSKDVTSDIYRPHLKLITFEQYNQFIERTKEEEQEEPEQTIEETEDTTPVNILGGGSSTDESE